MPINRLPMKPIDRSRRPAPPMLPALPPPPEIRVRMQATTAAEHQTRDTRLESDIKSARARLHDVEGSRRAIEQSKTDLSSRLSEARSELKATQLVIIDRKEDTKSCRTKLEVVIIARRCAEERPSSAKPQQTHSSEATGELQKILSAAVDERRRIESRCTDMAASIENLKRNYSHKLGTSDILISSAAGSAKAAAEKRAEMLVRKAKEEMGWNQRDMMSEEDVDRSIEAVNLASEEKWRKRYHQQTNTLKESLMAERKRHVEAAQREEIALDAIANFQAVTGSVSPQHRALQSTVSLNILHAAEATAAAELRERRANEVMQQGGRSSLHHAGPYQPSEDESRASSPTEPYFAASASRPSTPSDYSPEELYSIGITFRDGIGVSKDFPTAFKYFETATDQGNIDAAVALADCYQRGLGIEQDEEAAVRLYEQAAEQGHTVAMLNLSLLNLGMTFSPEANAGGSANGTRPSFRHASVERSRWVGHPDSSENIYQELSPRSNRSTRTDSSQRLNPQVYVNANGTDSMHIDESPPVSSVSGVDDDGEAAERQISSRGVRPSAAQLALARESSKAEQRALKAERALHQAEHDAEEAKAALVEKEASLERTRSEMVVKFETQYAKQTESMESRLAQLEKSGRAEVTAREASERQEREARESLRAMERRLQAAEAVKSAAIQARVQADMQPPPVAVNPLTFSRQISMQIPEAESHAWHQRNKSAELELHREKIRRPAAEKRAAEAEDHSRLMIDTANTTVPASSMEASIPVSSANLPSVLPVNCARPSLSRRLLL